MALTFNSHGRPIRQPDRSPEMDMRKMLEKAITFVIAKGAEHWNTIWAVMLAVFGGGVAFLMDVKNGNRQWDWSAFTLSIISSGFFGLITYTVFSELFGWSPSMSAAGCAIVGHLGAEKVKQLLTDFFTKKLS